MKKTISTRKRLDVVFRAFADPTRLRMLFLLQGGELCVGNIVDILQIEQPSASRHLAYLRKANLVAVRKAGLWSYYSLAPARTPFHAKLLECLACCFAEVPELRADQVRAKQIRESGGCCPGQEQPKSPKARKGNDAGECCVEP
jgi:ArsR family transcriptional regulator